MHWKFNGNVKGKLWISHIFLLEFKFIDLMLNILFGASLARIYHASNFFIMVVACRYLKSLCRIIIWNINSKLLYKFLINLSILHTNLFDLQGCFIDLWSFVTVTGIVKRQKELLHRVTDTAADYSMCSYKLQ